MASHLLHDTTGEVAVNKFQSASSLPPTRPATLSSNSRSLPVFSPNQSVLRKDRCTICSMGSQQRGRSPRTNDLRPSISPSLHQAFNSHASPLGLDPSLLSPPTASVDPFDTQTQTSQSTFSRLYCPVSDRSQPVPSPSNLSSHTFLQAQGDQQLPPSYYQQTQFEHRVEHTPSNLFDASFDELNSFNASFLDNTGPDPQDFDPAQFLSLSVLEQSQFNNPPNTATTNGMAVMHQPSPEPAHLLQSDMRRHSASFHPTQTSPSFQQGVFASPHQSHRTSLDPSSAQLFHGQNNDWSGMIFRNYQRAPSDNHSDISSSAQPSPYLGNSDIVEPYDQHLPLINGQLDPGLYHDALGLSRFTLSDTHLQQQHITPGPSPHMSPHLAPQQTLPPYTAADSFGMLSMDNAFNLGLGLDNFSGQGQDGFPSLLQTTQSGDFLFQEQMSPPEISIDFAPPAKQLSFNEADSSNHNVDALSPPERVYRNRARARSDPYITPGPSRGTSPKRPRSPSLGLHPADPISRRSLSRSSSPAAPSAGIHKSTDRRSSTSSLPHNRNYLLGLARHESVSSNPDESNGRAVSPPSGDPSVGSEANKKGQKHPATFQCHLCPKRFTRAYNLRSHLRTHTDERPFVCTVCGKAFARQHDRKRHEGLHSGEKKFVCGEGGVQGEITWGCGRKFARADALGRHFRSEAGRACIKPLLEEEARERQAAVMDQANQEMLEQQQHNGMQPGPIIPAGSVDYGNMQLPAALLQMYPALASIQWDTAAGVDEGDYEYNGRSSFDASSGGEFGDEDDTGYISDLGPVMSTSFAVPAWGVSGDGNGYANAFGQR